VAETGELWLAGDHGFVLEGLNRAGGLMCARQMKEPPPPAPRDAEPLSPRPFILYGAFAPGPGERVHAEAELDTAQEQIIKQLFTEGRKVFTVTPLEINPWGHGVDLGDVRPPVDLTPVDGLSLAAPVVTTHLWVFTAELVAALTRDGKMPPMYQSVLVPNGRERNTEHLKLDWEPGPIDPIGKRLLGREYLARVANSLRKMRNREAEKFAAAGQLAAETERAGHAVWYASLGHLPPQLPNIPGDPGIAKPLSMSKPDTLGDFVKPGDLILYVGYYEPYGPWVETAHELGAKIVTVVSGTPERRAEDMGADININGHWAYGDAAVEVRGYDIRVLPPSGVIASCAYYMLMAEFQAAR
jgi:uncharacterized phosphosugar-binding protein